MWDDYFDNIDISPFDQEIEHFKDTLKECVNNDIKKELEKLRKENEELQSVKKNFDKIKEDYARKERELEGKERDLERQVSLRMFKRAFEKAFPAEKVYIVREARGFRIPKCDKCDDKRYVHFTSPYGREYSEPCPYCGNVYDKYIVNEAKARRLVYREKEYIGPSLKTVYLENGNPRYANDWREHNFDINICSDEISFEELKNTKYHRDYTVFISPEKANAFCNFMNSGKPENLEPSESSDIDW